MRPRPLLCSLLGLILLLQGWALAASPRGSVDTDQADVATTSVPAAIGCPGHRSAVTVDDIVDHAPASPPSCCDAACPDMLNCALGQLATASPAPTGNVHPPQTPRPESAVALLHPQQPGRLLRPPIPLHA